MRETIEETTVGSLGGADVPMANATPNYTFALPDGSVGRGPACMLILPGGAVWVGAGSEVEVEGRRWRVICVRCPDDDTGSVTLEGL